MEPIKIEIVVVGAGPGGYAAAFYAADRGKKVLLVEQDTRLNRATRNHLLTELRLLEETFLPVSQ